MDDQRDYAEERAVAAAYAEEMAAELAEEERQAADELVPHPITFTARREYGLKTLYLSVGWMDGHNDESGVSVDLTCGAGVGGGHMRLTVTKGGRRVSETIDMTAEIHQWAKRLEALL